jgi:NADPH-dependent 2,4-dienoyl-CoA reductase/sulfur reductase-like enzyme/nitrite reductase/ring-hydroxylating ferredoxin subunit
MSDAFSEVAILNAIPQGGMIAVEHQGETILLVRNADTVSAVGGTCPHAGAPLVEGVRHGDRIICPWHKAAFCTRTGKLLDPPAVDGLPSYQVRIEQGRILVAKASAEAKPADPTKDNRCFVIAGAGAAGAMAAQTLREEGFAGRVLMLDAINRVPYDRTLLSKYVLSGENGAEKSPLQSQAFYQAHDIERRTAEIVHVDPAQRRIICADGSVIPYDAALLATGSTAVMPALPGIGLHGVFSLRSRADADAILQQAERSTRAVVLGASFIGMEVAASLRERGLEVVVVGKERIPFEKQLGAKIGSALMGLHTRRGVMFRLESEVAALQGDRAVGAVLLKDGTRIDAGLVVVGFGVKPVTAHAEALNRREDGGIIVDAQLRAAPGLFAAGDIACFPDRGDGPPIRVEHWRVAEQHGRLAALNMLGRSMPYEAVPVFWTIQYMKRLDYAGHATEWDAEVIHGDLSKPEFIAYYVTNGLVAAASGIDRDKDMAALIELFALKRQWTAAELGSDPAGVLASLDRAG